MPKNMVEGMCQISIKFKTYQIASTTKTLVNFTLKSKHFLDLFSRLLLITVNKDSKMQILSFQVKNLNLWSKSERVCVKPLTRLTKFKKRLHLYFRNSRKTTRSSSTNFKSSFLSSFKSSQIGQSYRNLQVCLKMNVKSIKRQLLRREIYRLNTENKLVLL